MATDRCNILHNIIKIENATIKNRKIGNTVTGLVIIRSNQSKKISEKFMFQQNYSRLPTKYKKFDDVRKRKLFQILCG